jgi:LmbE family N-acetylglucosaminyl deacetylase
MSSHRPPLGSGRVMLHVLSTAVLFLLLAPAVRPAAQVRAIPAMGTAGILHQILKLRTTASVLLVGAHPDDEDSLFISRVARGDHARVGYLSLTRGEGGQNAIGSELFDALGVIRTEELLQARTLDGGDQFFGRAFDYGFSKTLEEAARQWGEREVLADIVRIIRLYRPLVVYSVFSGTPVDGHGHHQLVGWLTPVAFHAAADPAQFPEQIAEGLRPWQARKLYRGTGLFAFGGGPGTTIRVEEGQLDPLLGRSYVEIAAEGRSQHKTQGMGSPELRGPLQSGLALLEPSAPTGPAETSVFDGIDTSITGLAAVTGLPPGALKQELGEIDVAVNKALDSYSVLAPGNSVPALAEALLSIRAARAAIRTVDASPDAKADANFILAAKEEDATLALQGASGIAVDFISDTETVAAGESFLCTVRVFLAQPRMAKITTVVVKTPDGWVSESAPPAKPGPGTFPEVADRTDIFRLTVPADALPSQPYWLTVPRGGQVFDWPSHTPKGAPFDPPSVIASVHAEIGGVTVSLSRPLQYRMVDRVRGELRRDVDVVPAVTLSFDTPLELIPLEMRGKARRVSVVLQSNSQSPIAGSMKLDLPQGWTISPAESPFAFQRKGERTTLACMVTPSGKVAPGTYTLHAHADVQGNLFDRSLRVIAYPHIQTHRMYARAAEQICVLDLKVKPVKVGYVMGTGDQVPEALRRMGLDVSLLDESALTSGDLARFGTIVVGINASAARPDFVAEMPRLFDYAQKGGTLIVQYQQQDYVQRNLPPFPAQMASRVTDETAPVSILSPGHAVFTVPNKIGPDDFLGWVQERNLNAFTTFDPRFTALLESHDEGEPPQRGGEVYARLGKGHYVYTAYAWFRQLPAGVPGAYRMFANLVSLGASRE